MKAKPIFSIFFIVIFILLSVSVNLYGISPDELALTVIFLRHQSQEFEDKGIKKLEVWYRDPATNKYEPKFSTKSGTGFLVKHNGRDYLVTAKHVADFLDPNSEVIINLASGKISTVKFGRLMQSPSIRGSKWFRHQVADMAVHPIGYTDKPKHISFPSLNIPGEDPEIPLLSTVWVMGFPLGLGTSEPLSPIAKKAQIASKIIYLDSPDIDPNLKFIMLDEALAQGYSGAPVIWIEDVLSSAKVGQQHLKAGERIHLIGIASMTFPDKTGGKISAIVPISYLMEIFHSSDFNAYEKQLPDPNQTS
jgi:hypothetical protein